MSEMVWKMVTCPQCGESVAVRLMSLAARCPCGAYYADTETHRGWYVSREAYEQNKGKIDERTADQ
jgi:hypothetical protein